MNAKQRRRASRQDAQTTTAFADAKPPPEASNVVAIRAQPGVSVPVVKPEVGLSGTTNWNGRLQTEANTALQHALAYGQAGTLQWGEWEKLVRTDPSANQALEMVAAPLREATVDVKPPDDSPQAAKVADLVRDNLSKWMDPTWSAFIDQLSKSSLTYGFAMHEVVLGTRPDPRVPGGLAVYVAKMAQRLASSIHEEGWIEKGGDLSEIRQHGLRDGHWQEDIRIPAEKLSLLSWNREGNNYAGFSAFRPVWYLAKQRAELAKIIAIGHQRESCGIPVATMDKDVSLSAEQRSALQTLVENLVYHENAAAQLPPGVKLDFLFSQGSNKGHLLDAWSRFGLAILETLFAQQAHLGTSDTGSRAVGEVHVGSQAKFVLGVKAHIEAVLNGTGQRAYEGLVQKIVRPNFGELAAYPTVTLVLKKADVSVAEFATAVPALAKAGALTLTFKDELAVREKLGLSPIEEADWKAEREKKAAVAQQIAGAMGKGEGDEGDGTDPEEASPSTPPGSASKKPAFGAKKFADGTTFSRPLFAHEEHVQFAEMDTFLTTARERFEKDALDEIAVMVADALPEIRAALVDGDPSELEGVKLKTKRLRKLAAAFVAKTRAQGYRSVANERRASLAFAFAAEEEDDKNPTIPPFEPDVAPASPLGTQAKKAETLDTALTSRLTNRITTRVEDDIFAEAMRVARTGGNAEDAATGVLAKVLETRGLRADAGSVLTTAFNMGREQFAEEHADEVTSVHISAVMDRNTCDYCAGLDGRELEFGSAEEQELTPPLSGCAGRDADRCIKVFGFRK